MPNAAHLALTVALAALTCAGCTIYPGTARPVTLDELRAEEGWVLLDAVPFVPQVSQKGCGAACLAMVLGHWDEAADAASLEAECAGAESGGIRAAALRDAAKRRGLSAFLFEGSVADLEHELARGRPVVVGLVKRAGDEFTSHFEVVIGIHRDGRRVAALDPALGPMVDSLEGFETEWRPTKGVTLVVFRPRGPAAAEATARMENGGER